MAGTKAGAAKAALVNKARYGKDFYARIGRIGGRNGHTGGFASDPELARRAGAKGGAHSLRTPNHQYLVYEVYVTGKRSAVARRRSRKLAQLYADYLSAKLPAGVDHYEIEQAPELSKDYEGGEL